MLSHSWSSWLLPFALILVTLWPCLEAIQTKPDHIIKTKTFLSPLFTLSPGSVTEKFYYNINFPTGHIALKSFDADVVDESGHPVPLFETYLHHWTLIRYYQHNKNNNNNNPNTNISFTKLIDDHHHQPADFIIASNNGVCQRNVLSFYYGMGTESRRTSNLLPDPYGIEVGNEDGVPLGGYGEKWCLNVHAIDTRGVEDRLGCIECRCDLYNVTEDGNGVALGDDYKGGMRCCYDKTRCRVREGYEKRDEERKLYVRYVVKWVDWDEDLVIPVKVYVFDATDTWKPLMNYDSTGLSRQQGHHCRVEYDVESCSLSNKLDGHECNSNATKRSKVMFEDNGFLVYGVAHQHIGGIGATLYGEDGRILCSSSPIYGGGNEVGNEDGYVVGMSSCYPKFGDVKIHNGEMGSLVSNYDSKQNHTGVMGIFTIVVADKIPNSMLPLEA